MGAGLPPPRGARVGTRGDFGRWDYRPAVDALAFSPRGVGGLRRGPVLVHEEFGGVYVIVPRMTLLRTSGQTVTTSSSTARCGDLESGWGVSER